MTTERRLQKHHDFWAGKPMESPLTSIRVGSAFISRQFQANQKLLVKGTSVHAEALNVDDYLEEYEKQYQTHEQVNQDAFFVAEPINGFPWIEAICGCEIVGADVSFVTKHKYHSLDDLESIQFSHDNEWYRKYLEFLDKLDKRSSGRFPLGQPILRGVSDTVGALVGQEEMVVGLMTEPEKMVRLFDDVVGLHRNLIDDAYKIIKPFHGGYSIGFYYLWTPGKAIWYQEDLAAIMSPNHFDEFLRKTGNEICRGYDYTLEHLHPASFGHLNGILSMPNLNAVQINREDVGPALSEIVSECRRVIEAGKQLVILGELDEDDVRVIAEELPNHHVALHCFTETVEAANDLSARIKHQCAKHWKK